MNKKKSRRSKFNGIKNFSILFKTAIGFGKFLTSMIRFELSIKSKHYSCQQLIFLAPIGDTVKYN